MRDCNAGGTARGKWQGAKRRLSELFASIFKLRLLRFKPCASSRCAAGQQMALSLSSAWLIGARVRCLQIAFGIQLDKALHNTRLDSTRLSSGKVHEKCGNQCRRFCATRRATTNERTWLLHALKSSTAVATLAHTLTHPLHPPTLPHTHTPTQRRTGQLSSH